MTSCFVLLIEIEKLKLVVHEKYWNFEFKLYLFPNEIKQNLAHNKILSLIYFTNIIISNIVFSPNIY